VLPCAESIARHRHIADSPPLTPNIIPRIYLQVACLIHGPLTFKTSTARQLARHEKTEL
jgi:hypothetical protein